MSNFRRLWGAVVIACVGVSASAQVALHDIAELDADIRAAVDVVGGGLRVQAVDRRLRLARCSEQPDISGPSSGAMIVRCASAGWRIRVPVISDAPLAATGDPAVRAPVAAPLIRRGDQIQILVSGRNFSVRTIGFAEQDGSAGQRIRVRNERRTGLFTGLVQADGSVLVSGIN